MCLSLQKRHFKRLRERFNVLDVTSDTQGSALLGFKFQPTVKNQQDKIELGTIPGTFESVRQSVSDSETGVEL